MLEYICEAQAIIAQDSLWREDACAPISCQEVLLKFISFLPIKTKTTNMVLRAPNNKEGEIGELPVEAVTLKNGEQWIFSTWKIDSIADRASFINNGEIVIGIMGGFHPPIAVVLPKE